MRLDRALTLGVFAPLRRLAPGGATIGALPILMYHSISKDPEHGVAPYFRTCTTPQRFAQQLDWMKEAGFHGVSLREGLRGLAARLEPADPEAPRPVVLTFDDGYLDNLEAALPILQRAGFAATLYVVTGAVGKPRNRKVHNGRECLTWDEVSYLHQEGIEIGAHTQTHPKLVDCPWDRIETELSAAKEDLEQHLQTHVDAFAYPYAYPTADAEFCARFEEYVREAGYRTNVTTEIGLAQRSDRLLRLPRLPINDCDDQRLLLAKLNGAYDPIALLQRLSKRRQRPADL